jgi:hypothetical protein
MKQLGTGLLCAGDDYILAESWRASMNNLWSNLSLNPDASPEALARRQLRPLGVIC